MNLHWINKTITSKHQSMFLSFFFFFFLLFCFFFLFSPLFPPRVFRCRWPTTAFCNKLTYRSLQLTQMTVDLITWITDCHLFLDRWARVFHLLPSSDHRERWNKQPWEGRMHSRVRIKINFPFSFSPLLLSLSCAVNGDSDSCSWSIQDESKVTDHWSIAQWYNEKPIDQALKCNRCYIAPPPSIHRPSHDSRVSGESSLLWPFLPFFYSAWLTVASQKCPPDSQKPASSRPLETACEMLSLFLSFSLSSLCNYFIISSHHAIMHIMHNSPTQIKTLFLLSSVNHSLAVRYSQQSVIQIVSRTHTHTFTFASLFLSFSLRVNKRPLTLSLSLFTLVSLYFVFFLSSASSVTLIAITCIFPAQGFLCLENIKGERERERERDDNHTPLQPALSLFHSSHHLTVSVTHQVNFTFADSLSSYCCRSHHELSEANIIVEWVNWPVLLYSVHRINWQRLPQAEMPIDWLFLSTRGQMLLTVPFHL